MAFPRYTTYQYDGYTYVGDYDEASDDGHRKMWHTITCTTGESWDVKEWGPYKIPTYQEFKDTVDAWSV